MEDVVPDAVLSRNDPGLKVTIDSLSVERERFGKPVGLIVVDSCTDERVRSLSRRYRDRVLWFVTLLYTSFVLFLAGTLSFVRSHLTMAVTSARNVRSEPSATLSAGLWRRLYPREVRETAFTLDNRLWSCL